MLNQYVSIGDIDRPDVSSTALSPLPSRDAVRAVDPDLKARLIRAAAASDLPSPHVIPGAAVLLCPIDLPLNSDRKRRAAAPFAMEPFLASTIDETHFAVGPTLSETLRLCAAINVEDLGRHVGSKSGIGAVLPDLCGVPIPDNQGAWSVWFGRHAVYLRTSDGGGCVVETEVFADLWRGFDRPPLMVCFGAVPPGVDVYERVTAAQLVDSSVFELDLRPFERASRDLWRSRLAFAVGLSVVAGLAHAAVLFTDARALERTVAERNAAFGAVALDRGASVDLSRPTSQLMAELERRANPADTTDLFLRLLARIGSALTGLDSVDFRDLRFDASVGALTILVRAPDLAALQQAEDTLHRNGMTLTSGAASTGAAGAEMQLILSEGP
ncbi:MAG: type II secretion system protein GspL [Pseudomonadota bacterium]